MEMKTYRSKFNKQDVNYFEDNIDRLQTIVNKSGFVSDKSGKIEILSEIIEDLIKFLKFESNVSEWV